MIGALKQIPLPEIPHGEEGLIESVWLLLTSVVVVPLVCKLPGGSPVLGFLVSAGPLLSPFLCASSLAANLSMRLLLSMFCAHLLCYYVTPLSRPSHL